jgi:hypothetical protein
MTCPSLATGPTQVVLNLVMNGTEAVIEMSLTAGRQPRIAPTAPLSN